MAERLRAGGEAVELLSDHFDADVADEEWIAEVGQRGWIILTKDKFIRRRLVELNSLSRGKSATFVLTGGNMTGDAMAEAFADAMRRMKQYVRDHQQPFIATVTPGGQVKMLLRKKEIDRAAGRVSG